MISTMTMNLRNPHARPPPTSRPGGKLETGKLAAGGEETPEMGGGESDRPPHGCAYVEKKKKKRGHPPLPSSSPEMHGAARLRESSAQIALAGSGPAHDQYDPRRGLPQYTIGRPKEAIEV